MTRPVSFMSVVVMAGGLTPGLGAQGLPSLKGAWKVVAVTGPDGTTTETTVPSLWLFTDTHYSVQRVTAPMHDLPDEPSDAERLAAVDPYQANSGTYEVKGTTLERQVVLATFPDDMHRPPSSAQLRFEGTSVVHVIITGAGGQKTVTTLQRVE
jgi:hypothetical protein